VLDTMTAGGVHPERVLLPVTTALSRATDSVVGPLGGMVPRPNGSQAPGPAAAAAVTTEIQRVGSQLRTFGASSGTVGERLRGLFGIASAVADA
jgi:hypothetical protein